MQTNIDNIAHSISNVPYHGDLSKKRKFVTHVRMDERIDKQTLGILEGSQIVTSI